MTMPKSIDAYKECDDIFERALNSPKGFFVIFADERSAIQFRIKMNVYRDKLRKKNRGIYPEDHPQHGTSPYDAYKIAIDPENKCRVTIERYEIKAVTMGEL